jgi:RNA polymerase sigma-70 factor (ECF subfamily)
MENLAVAVHRNTDGAVERLVRLHQDSLFGYTLRLLRDHFAAQEVTQDTFLRAIRALTCRYDEKKCSGLVLKPWLFRIARNLAFDRRRILEPAKASLPENGGEAEMNCFAQPAADRSLEQHEQRVQMEKALGMLDPGARDLILLRFMEEMSYADIARVVSSSESAVRGKVFRALRSLRKTLEKTGGAI